LVKGNIELDKEFPIKDGPCCFKSDKGQARLAVRFERDAYLPGEIATVEA